jgi:nucleotide-binding universal stress UspA family protein
MADTESAAAKAKRQRRKQEERIFMVVVDKSEEMRVALRYASLRAKATGGRVALFTAIEPADSHTWQAVGELMEEEQRADAEAMMQRFAEEVVKLSGKTPVLFIRPGVSRDALLQLIDEEPSVSILILAAGDARGGPGPLIQALTGKYSTRLTIPLTIVPGTLTDDEIDALT